MKSLKIKQGDTEIRLSKRALQLLEMLEQGCSNKQVAGVLGISEHTVKAHFWRLFNRIGVNSRAQALRWWRDNKPENNKAQALQAFFNGVCAELDSGTLAASEQVKFLRSLVEI
jgi:DNA-binding CsgD family transcriptional regulator